MFVLGARMCVRTLAFDLAKFPPAHANKNPVILNTLCVRNMSFFNKLTQEDLWRSLTSVSNAGKKRGRGNLRRRKPTFDLNKGQRMGDGKEKVVLPGLNTRIIDSIDKLTPVGEKVPVKEDEEEKALVRKEKRVLQKIHPLERGWSGKSWKGRKLGPPEAVEDETFEDFESVVLDIKMRSFLTSTLGRQRAHYAIVATGNKNGLIGVGKAEGPDGRVCLNLAKKRASKRLLTINLINDNTINHDFVSEYGRTRIFVYKKPKGFGLNCHRAIKSLCELIGIKDLSAKIEGSTFVLHVIRAFIVGLLQQKSYQEIADDCKLHLVEFREECLNYPRVMASPQTCLPLSEVRKNPVLFEEYIMGNRLKYKPDPKAPFFTKLPSWKTHLKKTLHKRNHNQVKLDLLVKYGSYKSYLSDLYESCERKPKKLSDSDSGA